jgi:hypothetical protein
LGIVLEWKEPSSVTLHLIVAPAVNSSEVKVDLKLCSLVERFLAVALVAMAVSSRMAAVMAVSHCVVRVCTVLPPVEQYVST